MEFNTDLSSVWSGLDFTFYILGFITFIYQLDLLPLHSTGVDKSSTLFTLLWVSVCGGRGGVRRELCLSRLSYFFFYLMITSGFLRYLYEVGVVGEKGGK